MAQGSGADQGSAWLLWGDPAGLASCLPRRCAAITSCVMLDAVMV